MINIEATDIDYLMQCVFQNMRIPTGILRIEEPLTYQQATDLREAFEDRFPQGSYMALGVNPYQRLRMVPDEEPATTYTRPETTRPIYSPPPNETFDIIRIPESALTMNNRLGLPQWGPDGTASGNLVGIDFGYVPLTDHYMDTSDPIPGFSVDDLRG